MIAGMCSVTRGSSRCTTGPVGARGRHGGRTSGRWYGATSLAAAAIAIVALSIAPAIAYFGPHTLAPRQKLAAMVTALWHDKTKTRLSLVAGTRLYADEIAFYSSDNPSEFIGFSFEFAPWVSPAAIANNGFIAVCKDGDTQCIENASRFAGGGALPQRVNLPGTKEYFSVMSIVPAKGQ